MLEVVLGKAQAQAQEIVGVCASKVGNKDLGSWVDLVELFLLWVELIDREPCLLDNSIHVDTVGVEHSTQVSVK